MKTKVKEWMKLYMPEYEGTGVETELNELLSRQRQETREKVEGMKNEIGHNSMCDCIYGNNSCNCGAEIKINIVEDILKLLEEE